MKYLMLLFAASLALALDAQEIPGTVARWDMNSNCELRDETSGARANGAILDVSLTENRDNKPNTALNFSQTTSYITFGAVEKLKLANDKSISFWINPALTGSTTTGTVFSYGTAINIQYREQSSAATLNIIFGNTSYMTVNLTAGAWQQVTVTFKKDFSATASKAIVYINGTLVAQQERSKTAHDFTGAIALIGPASQAALTNGFRGKLDDIKLFNRELTATEVSNMVLPVTISFFRGAAKKGIVEINWKTELEENVSYFELQKSVDGKKFFAINRTDPGTYIYQVYDLAGVPSRYAWYRLRVVDRDETMQFSNIIRVAANDDAAEALTLFPNPSSKYINVTGLNGSADIRFINSFGRVVKTQRYVPGNVLNVESLPAGFYYVVFSGENGTTTSKFIKK